MASIAELKCPGCSGVLKIPHEFSRVVTCPYCGLISKVQTGALDPTGAFARLTPSRSKVRIGMLFTHDGAEYTVRGRMRYQYDEGYWDEWWVASEDKSAWLEEDEGVFLLYTPKKITSKLPAYSEVIVGSTFEVNGKEFFVTEKNSGKVVGSEGELSEVFMPETALSIVDGAYDGASGSIEYWGGEISFSVAKEVSI